jgi:hypothetical protein
MWNIFLLKHLHENNILNLQWDWHCANTSHMSYSDFSFSLQTFDISSFQTVGVYTTDHPIYSQEHNGTIVNVGNSQIHSPSFLFLLKNVSIHVV